MIGLGTTVLARYFVQDDPEPATRASEVIEAASGRGEHPAGSAVVLCGLVWVLESKYGHARDAIADVLDVMLATESLRVERVDEVRGALCSYRQGRPDVPDGLVGRIVLAESCDRTMTFDRALEGNGTFEVTSCRSPVITSLTKFRRVCPRVS